MIKNICTILLLIQLFAYSGFAQQALPKITTAAFRDQLPKTFWNFKHVLFERGMPREYTLSDDRGKLILIDFWAKVSGFFLKCYRLQSLKALVELMTEQPKLYDLDKAF
ncbi:hypothetical protein [Pedobacter alluvionis]|uniref:Uncharacterized protein n=1 Tax=Pedobacter alluvionis TaxID=475253 RepID=A0A497XTI5_9SPHI|nr:hypothetical protein [Pedobacter alluvionis]RLJ72639.1 hypothetical protein BCL90_4270 [Pedobacter alluvionis]TFB28051.1 hypothetical protein E3V97_23765 [Pedobacter alluvionis]